MRAEKDNAIERKKRHQSRRPRRGGTPHRMLRGFILAGLVLAIGRPAHALINPGFTPVHLTQQSHLVVQLKLSVAGPKGKEKITAQVVKALKGTAPKAALIDMSEMRKEEAEAFVGQVRENGDGPVLLFFGKYEEEGGGDDMGGMGGLEAGGGRRIPPAFVHIIDRWLSVRNDKGGKWFVEAIDTDMQATWAGSTKMLIRCVKYVQSATNPAVPSKTGAAWEEEEERKIAKMAGKVHGALAVDVKGNGRSYLHILCEGGDRLFLYDKKAKKFGDVTGSLKLGAKSRVAAWADFDRNGTFDLASWDGKALTLWLQQKDGAFLRKATGVKLPVCTGLSVLGVGATMRAGLLVSTKHIPLLLTPGEDGTFSCAPIEGVAAGKWKGSALGEARPCVVADFDRDSVADIVQPFAAGVFLYRGRKGGGFEPASLACDVDQKGRPLIGTGKGFGRANAGDFDHDGKLDLFLVTEECCQIWGNVGGGKFVDTLRFSGELAYISKGDGRSAMTVDINNDGRQDVFITYFTRPPHLFFNRGFRSFGHSHAMDLEEHELFPKLKKGDQDEERDKKGQQAGVVHDFDGDGGQDMIIVLDDGEVWVYWREYGASEPLAVRAVLPASGPAGPVRVMAWSKKRLLGAWSVSPATSEAFFGLFEQGPCKLKWQFPGGKVRRKTVVVENKPLRVELTP